MNEIGTAFSSTDLSVVRSCGSAGTQDLLRDVATCKVSRQTRRQMNDSCRKVDKPLLELSRSSLLSAHRKNYRQFPFRKSRTPELQNFSTLKFRLQCFDFQLEAAR